MASTLRASVTSTTFTDLGAAPVQVQVIGAPVTVVVADSLPAPGTLGMELPSNLPVVFGPADDVSSHVYVAMLGVASVVAYAPMYVAAETIGAVTQATTPWVVRTTGYSYAHIVAGQATTVVKASAGTLHSISFNGPATTLNVTTIYDNATGVGTVIAAPTVTGLTAPVTLLFDLAFANGLTIITATANGADMTVTYV